MFKNSKIDKSNYFFSNKALLALFIPLLIEQFLEFVVGFADSLMVASLGEAAISGVSLVDFLMQLLIFGFSALGTGGAVIAGQYLGDNNVDEACNASNQLVWFNGLLSIGLMIIIFFLKSTIINLLFGTVSHDVWFNSDVYLSYVVFSIPFIALYNAGAAVFRVTGNARLPMKIMIICDIINIIGNAFCIFVLHTGVEGVAIPTVISRAIAAIVILILIVNTKYKLHIKKTLKHSFDLIMIKRLLNVALPYGIENGLFQLGRLLVLSVVTTFGTVAIAANSIGLAVSIFSVLPGFAINLGITAVIARCVGANDYEQARYYNKKCILIVFISHIIINIIIIGLLPLILSLYNVSPQTTNLARQMILLHSLFAIIIWPLSFTLPNTFRGAGDAKVPMIISLFVMFTCRIGLAYVLGIWLNIGVIGTWFAMFIDWYVRAGFYLIRYFKGTWTKYRAI